MAEPSFLRFPSVRDTLLAFVADDDLWLCDSRGGIARRLTADRAPAANTRISADGRLVAYTGWRDGAPEVYVVGTDGEPVRRLSWFGDPHTRVIGWRGDNEVLAVSSAGEPFRSRSWAYAVRVEPDGPPERLPYGPVSAITSGPGGAVVLGVNQGRGAAAWKRYRGGTASALWIDPSSSGRFERFLTQLDGQLEDPAFVGGRVVFVSDHEGVGNLYSVLPDGSDLLRHSDHAEFYARAANSDGVRVVYQCAGELWRIDELSPDTQPSRLPVELGSPRSGRARRTLRAADELGEHAPDETGRASAVEARGTISWLTHLEGPARWLGGGDGVRTRTPRVVGAGEQHSVLFVTDAEGDDAIEVVSSLGDAPPAGPRRIGAGQLGRVLELAGSPDSRYAAVATHDGRVVVADLTDGSLRTLDHSRHGEASGLTFSPDSAWLAWSHAGPLPLRHLKLARLSDGVVSDATPLRFDDHDPVFTLDGRYLAFLSVRTFDPVYDAHVFDLSFPAGTRPYLLALRASTPSPFAAELAGRPRPGAAKPATLGASPEAGEPRSDGAAPVPVAVDLDGIEERIVPFPVSTGRYSHLRAAADGVLYLLEPLLGVLGEARPRAEAEAPRARLLRYDLVKARQVELSDGLDSFEVSGDGRSVVVRDGKSLIVLPADRKVEEQSPGEEPDPGDRIDVDLGRVRLEVDPPVEWRQMYDEAARLMRDHFWIADMAGVDWDGVVARYRPWLDRIATRDDLSELIWEVQGELGTSHAYERPPERPREAERRLGLLGADLERDADGTWHVVRVLPGETSVLAARSPLAAPGVTVRAGDALLAVDGRPVEVRLGPQALLAGTANKPVELTILPAGSTTPRRIVVEPLADERALRYQHWVAGRRAAVHEASGGRLGYVHIPDMMGNGWAELHRDLRLEVARDALVIDVRDNGGGHVSELVLEKLARTVQAWDVNRNFEPRTYPVDSPRGVRVLVVDEHAGSDGDIVTAGFKMRRLGPVIGRRTWGGVIGIDARYRLVDGSLVTQPRYAFFFDGDYGWSVENHGVDPDIEVLFPPQDWASGRDPQLERAIEVALGLLEEHPPARPPDRSTRPSRVAPPLPPRP